MAHATDDSPPPADAPIDLSKNSLFARMFGAEFDVRESAAGGENAGDAGDAPPDLEQVWQTLASSFTPPTDAPPRRKRSSADPEAIPMYLRERNVLTPDKLAEIRAKDAERKRKWRERRRAEKMSGAGREKEQPAEQERTPSPKDAPSPESGESSGSASSTGGTPRVRRPRIKREHMTAEQLTDIRKRDAERKRVKRKMMKEGRDGEEEAEEQQEEKRVKRRREAKKESRQRKLDGLSEEQLKQRREAEALRKKEWRQRKRLEQIISLGATNSNADNESAALALSLLCALAGSALDAVSVSEDTEDGSAPSLFQGVTVDEAVAVE